MALTLVAPYVFISNPAVRPVKADTMLNNLQLQQNPDYSRTGHMSLDPVPNRKDYIFLGVDPTDTNPQVENRRTWLEAWTPTGSQLFRVDTTFGGTRKPMQAIIDVVDLNGDGNDEIVGMFGAEIPRGETPLLFVFNGNGTLKWCTDQYSGVQFGAFKPNMQLKPQRVKIFDVKSANLSAPKQKRIVAVPNTDGDEPTDLTPGNHNDVVCSGSYANVRQTDCTTGPYENASAWVFFYGYDGPLPDVNANNPVPAPIPAVNDLLTTYPNREMITRPGIVVGDVDNAGNDNEVVIFSKHRIMVFNQDGSKVHFKQIVDPMIHDFVGYTNAEDDPDGSAGNVWDAWGGRRYGVYKLTDIDVPKNGTLELVLAGDGNPIDTCKSPGALYEAYRLIGPKPDGTQYSLQDDYLSREWRWWLRNTSAELTPTGWPSETYRLGCPFFGIQDVSGDGYDDIVLGRLNMDPLPCTKPGPTAPTAITIVETRRDLLAEDRKHELNYPGIPLDLIKWSASSPRDIVAYDNVTQQHKIYRVNGKDPNTHKFILDTIGTFATGSKLLHRKHSESGDLVPYEAGSNSPVHSWLQTPTVVTGDGVVTTVVEQTSKTCDGGSQTLKSWTVSGTTLVQSLNVASSPGRLVNILCAGDSANSVWLFENGSSCTSNTNQVSTYVQSGAGLSLFAGGGDGIDTIGLYSSGAAGFFLRDSNTGGNATSTFNFGTANLVPISGDWDGDGDTTVGVYNPATGGFFLRNTNSGGAADMTFIFGAAGLVPITGDWDGDGDTTVGLYNPASGSFFLKNSNSGGSADLTFNFGGANLVPITGDWDGDGDITVGVYNPATGGFFLRNANSGGAADVTFIFGGTNLVPITGDWDGDGDTTVGVYIPSTAAFFLKNANSGGSADLTFNFGPTGLVPITGNWDGNCCS